MNNKISKAFLFSLLCAYAYTAAAQKDTLRVMGYNVLYYGNGKQGPNSIYHAYLKTIVAYANPDILSLEKMAAIPVSRDDKYGIAPFGFADSIVDYALDAAFPGRYAYCPFTNAAKVNNVQVLFYDQRKLGFLSIVSSYTNITDFNTYKLYYKDPNLAKTHDTTFLYVTPTHDRSGDENEKVRGAQIGQEMRYIKAHFSRLPNMISIGDFNAHSSEEPFYQILTAPADTKFRFSDPPFYPDRRLSYPAKWNKSIQFSEYLTTSTRELADVPNSQGTPGGAKDWYDHIFLSQWIINNTNYIKYIPYSYHTIGNDGQRLGISINDKSKHVNNAAPPEVIEALFQMSNKYPTMLALEVTSNTSGISPVNPEIAGIKVFVKSEISITNPVGEQLDIHFPEDMTEQAILIECLDKDGNVQLTSKKTVKELEMKIPCELKPGEYTLRITGHHSTFLETKFIKG